MNTKIIKFDLNRRLYENIVAKQGDTKSRFLLFNLLDGAVPFNLSNRSVRVYGLKKDGTEIFNDLIVNNATKGYCTLELTNQMLSLAGEVELELMIIEGDKKLTSNVFTLEVRKSINSDEAIESTHEFSALLNALKEIDEWNREFADKSGKLEELYTPRLNELDAKLAEIATIIDFVKLEDETWDEAINRVITLGNKVKFLNKRYELYDTIILKNNTILDLHEETELVRMHDKQMFISESSVNTIKYEGVNNISVTGGIIIHNGNDTPRNMFSLFHARNIKFENVTFKNIVASHAIDLVGCENVEIQSCKFLGYDNTKSNEKFREVIQIDVCGQTGTGYDTEIYPVDSKCFDGTRTKNVLIENCIFDKSDTLPPAHNCIGTHSQVANSLEGDVRSNNITIRNNVFIGNGLITTEKDDGDISKAGKCIRLIQMSDVTIEGNIIKNYGRAVSCEIFAKYRALNGEVVTDEEKVKEQNIGNVNVTIINNTIECPDVEESYKWNCISIDSQITTAFHHNFKINGNNIKNNGVNDNRSIGIRNLNTCLSTYNNIDGGGKGYYIEIDTSKDIITRDNNYKNVTVPVDFVGAYTEGSGECLTLLEDGTNRKYLIYVPNSVENISQKPSIRIKSVESGNFSDLVIKQKPDWINATYNEGVSDYSSSVKCKFAKDDFGFVHLEGACTHQANQSNLTLFTLPEGYRPTMNLAFVTVASGSSGKATNRIKVNTNGTVVLESTDSESSTPYTNLNGIIFST
ncbi:BppU family phage baseplate upper protein [Clostridium tertium]